MQLLVTSISNAARYINYMQQNAIVINVPDRYL